MKIFCWPAKNRLVCGGFFNSAFALINKIIFKGRVLTKIVGESCFVGYRSTCIGIKGNKVSSEGSLRGEGKFSRRLSAFASTNKIIFEGSADIKTVCEPCFVDRYWYFEKDMLWIFPLCKLSYLVSKKILPYTLYEIEGPPFFSNPSCCTVEKAFYRPLSFISSGYIVCSSRSLLHSSQVLTVPFQIVCAETSGTFLSIGCNCRGFAMRR